METAEPVEGVCAVKTYADGEPFVIFEMPFLPSLPDTYMGLDLRPGTTPEQAEALAAMINAHCTGVSALMFGQDE